MSMFRNLDISASGLQAGRIRMDVIAQNIANADSGGNGLPPYRRKEVVMVSQPLRERGAFVSARTDSGGVRVLAVREDQSPNRLVYRPGDPAANQDGYVELSNVSLPMEMVDMVAASRAYESNAAALKAARQLAARTLDILR